MNKRIQNKKKKQKWKRLLQEVEKASRSVDSSKVSVIVKGELMILHRYEISWRPCTTEMPYVTIDGYEGKHIY